MVARISFFRRFSLLCSFSICLISLAGFAQAQGTRAITEITGEASVVIYDDFAKGRSETRDYIIDRVKNRETRVFFNKRLVKRSRSVVVAVRKVLMSTA